MERNEFMKKFRNEFPKRLKNIRKEKGITQQRLATETGISVESIKNYETGRRIPSYDVNLYILAKYFDVTPDFLMGVD